MRPCSLRPIRRGAVTAFALLLVLGAVLPAQGQPPQPQRGDDSPLRPLATQLDGSLDLGDHAAQWSKEVSIEGTERLLFRWSTSHSDVAAARWEVRGTGGELLASGELTAVPPAGEHHVFQVAFEGIPLTAGPRVRVVPLRADGSALQASPPVLIVEAGASQPTDFTDRGLAMPIDSMLEAVRKELGVPALGGATVTLDGIDALDAVGIRKHGASTPVGPDDLWHLGSDTKAMTATLIGILVEEGVVSWQTTVAAAFPEWAETMDARFHKTTLEHLAAHRSGIVDVSSQETAALGDLERTLTERRRAFAHLLTTRSHAGQVGGAYDYQNSNFILAGAILEQRTGKSWEELMRSKLFGPLGMKTAGFGVPGAANGLDQPWGHSDESGERVASQGDNTEALGPAGTVHASLRDWAKFIRLHLDGSEGSLSLQPATLARLHQQFPPTPASPMRYGWGWILFDDGIGAGLSHDGSNTLWYCSAQVYPEQGVAFLAVTNIGGAKWGKGDQAAWEVIRKLRERHLE